jgi:hypothetical protein
MLSPAKNAVQVRGGGLQQVWRSWLSAAATNGMFDAGFAISHLKRFLFSYFELIVVATRGEHHE